MTHQTPNIKHEQTWMNLALWGVFLILSLSLASLKMYLLDINIEIPPEFYVGFSSDNYIIRT